MKCCRFKIFALTFSLLLLISSAAVAGEFSKVGTAGAQFLKIGIGARYIALGEASTAMVNDAYSMFWNPAGMAKMDETEFAFTNVDWIEDISLNFISFARPVGFGGTFGLAFTMLDVGDMEETTVWEQDGTGLTFDAASYSLAVGYARSLTDRYSLGITMKYVSERIADVRSSTFAFDVGSQFEVGYENLRMGLNISNLGPEMKFSGQNLDFRYRPDQDNTNYDPVNASLMTEDYKLPLTFRFGLAYDILNAQKSCWTVAADAKHPNDNVQQMSLGTEYTWDQTVSLRAGYKFRCEEEGLTLGGGAVLNPTPGTALAVDYAWSDFGHLESVHRFSFGFRF